MMICSLPVLKAQDNWQDVVYLKNGSYLRGTVTELVTGESLKIKLENGVILAKLVTPFGYADVGYSFSWLKGETGAAYGGATAGIGAGVKATIDSHFFVFRCGLVF